MRISYVNSARKDQGNCEVCREPITAGMSYKFVSPRYGAKRKRHGKCRTWQPSELTSAKIATALAAQEGALEDLELLRFDKNYAATIEEITRILEVCAEGATECAAEYQESLDAMPEQLQYGPVGEQIQEKIEACESWAEELEGWSPDSEEPEYDVHPSDWFDETVGSAREIVENLDV